MDVYRRLWTESQSACFILVVSIKPYLVEGDGLEAPLSFKMTQWSCYCIGESVCYWLEKGNSMDTWRWRTTLIKSKRCYWMTASLYRKYNTFSESEQQHSTMTSAEGLLQTHPLLLTMIKQSWADAENKATRNLTNNSNTSKCSSSDF